MELSDIRDQIDEIDGKLTALFIQRMELSAKVAEYKRANNLPIYVPAREQEILRKLASNTSPLLSDYVRDLYLTIFELSRDYQHMCNNIADNEDTSKGFVSSSCKNTEVV